MSALNPTTPAAVTGHLTGAAKTFFDEVSVVLGALLNPRQVLEDVEQMRKLLKTAHAIELTDPARAAVLRERASRIGLN
ncbi:hypothetical protein [Variovorax sp.]|uniref:hypothetical protein n=1 Tax=Variovorax sp. TaxID=1871043 RepID=UPI002D71A08C|nr:hypothetical protein [Variovorax sp.]HYP84102.1 hypothetical protein [Variovorax sp.]